MSIGAICYRCNESLEYQKIGFRDSCPRCGVDLHCCLNCEFYSPGAYNDCLEPMAERVVDKSKNNHCEYFRARTSGTQSSVNSRKQIEKLDNLFKK